MAWKTVAQGTTFSDLTQTVADMELPPGTKIQARFEVGGWEWVFDVAGAELVFRAMAPDGIDVIDAYGENGWGYVDMEVSGIERIAGRISAFPIALAAVLAFIKAHWVAIAIVTALGTFALATIVSLIIIAVKFPAVAAIPVTLLVGAALGIIGLVLLSSRAPPRVEARR